jgi:hypothetical protein
VSLEDLGTLPTLCSLPPEKEGYGIAIYIGLLVRQSVRPHITLSAFFSAVGGRIDLKFGSELRVFQFLPFFFLSFSSNSSLSSLSSSSEIKIIYN